MASRLDGAGLGCFRMVERRHQVSLQQARRRDGRQVSQQGLSAQKLTMHVTVFVSRKETRGTGSVVSVYESEKDKFKFTPTASFENTFDRLPLGYVCCLCSNLNLNLNGKTHTRKPRRGGRGKRSHTQAAYTRGDAGVGKLHHLSWVALLSRAGV